MSDYDDGYSATLDDRGAPTHTCEDCGTVVREGRGCPECEYGLEEGGEG